MIDLLDECQRLLNQIGCATVSIEMTTRRALAFESATVLGFVVAYDNAVDLLDRWSADADWLIKSHQLGLRRAQGKAWNTYTIFLAGAEPTYGEVVALSAVEEDLTGTRKIARAGIRDVQGIRATLLPLLPIQNAPRLEAVDMTSEIRLRTTGLPRAVVEAFLSGAPEASVAQVLEEEP